MGSTVLRPILCTFLYPLPHIPHHHARTIAHTATRQSPAPKRNEVRTIQKPQKSPRVASIEAANRDRIPNDLGLIHGTLVMPTGARKPSFFSRPRERWRLELYRLKKRFIEFAALMYYKYGIGQKPNRPRLNLRSTAPVAAALHLQMYSAFAEGDLPTLQTLCASGLLEKFRAHIARRPPGERLEWTLHKQIRAPRVVSHRCLVLARVNGAALRQAVVRIDTRQSLKRIRQDGSVVEGTGGEKVRREYLVVQRRMRQRVEEPWVVWGTVEETDWEGLLDL